VPGGQSWLEHLQTLFTRPSPARRPLTGSSTPQRTVTAALVGGCRRVQTREQFVLLARQRLAYELVIHEVEKARRADARKWCW
jgi:hypothetical protein